MDILECIKATHSKENTLLISQYIGADKQRFAKLMALFFSDEVKLQQRAAWVAFYCYKQHPQLIKPYLNRLITNMEKAKHDAVLRNSLHILETVDIPEEMQGITFELCYNFIADPSRPIAIRIFSMPVVFNIAKKMPDLLEEVKLLIEEHYEQGSAGFKSRGRKILKCINAELGVG